jgi:hypothetical protein
MARMATSAETISTIGYFVAFVLGGIATAVIRERGESRRLQAAKKAELEARAEERRITDEARKREVQRETVFELQDAVAQVMRQNGRMHVLDVQAFRAGTRRPLPDDVGGEAALEAQKRAAILASRVTDESIRELYRRLNDAQAQLVVARSEQESNVAIGIAAQVYDLLNVRLGEVIRTL